MPARSTNDAPELLDWLALLGDLTRLRILRLLGEEELGVGELARVVQAPQSSVSRHLKSLLESGWVIKRSVGTSSMYRFDLSLLDDDARDLWTVARRRLEQSPAFDGDAHRLREVLASRHTDTRAFFGRIGGEWDHLRSELFGDRFTAEALLAFINPDWVVADIGCGTGNAAEHLAPLVKRVIAIDREPAMLEAARRRLAGCGNVDFRSGDLSRLPLKDQEIDAALVFLVMHHVSDPAAAVREIARSLRPGGMVMIVDMLAHHHEAYRHTMGHIHLGFTEKDVRAWARAAGLHLSRYRPLRPDTERRGPGLFVATLKK